MGSRKQHSLRSLCLHLEYLCVTGQTTNYVFAPLAHKMPLVWTLEQRHRMWEALTVYVRLQTPCSGSWLMLCVIAPWWVYTAQPPDHNLTEKAFVRGTPRRRNLLEWHFLCKTPDLFLFTFVLNIKSVFFVCFFYICICLMNTCFTGKWHPYKLCSIHVASFEIAGFNLTFR